MGSTTFAYRVNYREIAGAVLAGILLAGATAASAAQQKFRDWRVDCPADQACVAHLDQKGVQILVGRTKAKAPVRVAFRISVGAQKGKPVALRLDDAWQAALRVGACNTSYCEAGVAAKSTDLVVAALSRNNRGLIAYEAKDRLLLIPFSLSGFGEAMRQVKK